MATKLSEVEIFYIENNMETLDDELAKKLNRSLSAIKKVKDKKRKDLAKIAIVTPVPVEEPQPEPQPNNKEASPLRKSFGHVRKNGHSLATVMTPAASELGDASKKKGKKPFSEQFKDCVFKPYGDNHGE